MKKNDYKVVIDDEHYIDKPLVALTSCEVTFEDQKSLDLCVDSVRESTFILNARPANEVKYSWHNPVAVRGLTLHFGVRWFDKAFFEEKMDIYKNSMHESLFSKFGVNAAKFKVSHFVAM